MKSYYRVMLGKKSVHANECFKGSFMGTDFGVQVDLAQKLYENWREFNHEFIPVFLQANPEKSRVAAGLACSAIWTVSKGLKVADIILSPDGMGNYRVGLVSGEYSYALYGPLPHRRPVNWTDSVIPRADMSEALRNSTGSIGTISDISRHHEEIERLLGSRSLPTSEPVAESTDNPLSFALEEYLQSFLMTNWQQTELGRDYDIYTDDGELVGGQYPTDSGNMDVLAISKDKKTLLVVELKRGRVSDRVIGQIQRYMGFVLQELAEEGQAVRGAIIGFEDDFRIRRALAVAPNIDFYRYQVSFKLVKG